MVWPHETRLVFNFILYIYYVLDLVVIMLLLEQIILNHFPLQVCVTERAQQIDDNAPRGKACAHLYARW